MKTSRIKQAISDIETNEAALAWLEQYGTQITGRDRDQATVRIDFHFANACPGSKEAVEITQAFARIDLPNIVQTAILNCRNTIAMAKDAIREEVSTDGRLASQEQTDG